jgi:hypothetical protein
MDITLIRINSLLDHHLTLLKSYANLKDLFSK